MIDFALDRRTLLAGMGMASAGLAMPARDRTLAMRSPGGVPDFGGWEGVSALILQRLPCFPRLRKGGVCGQERCMSFTSYMSQALEEARAAAARGEVPVGAVIVAPDGQVVAQAGNRTRELNDPTAHAEIVAIRAAARALGNERLTDCELWVTLEPCAMCAGAIAHARIAKLYYGASDPKGGAVEHGARVFDQPQCLHRPEIYSGMGEREAGALLRGFFERLR